MRGKSAQSQILALAFLAVMHCFPAIAQDFQTGLSAYNSQDYDAALENWLPLAEKGNSSAQYGIGVMYDSGKGVPKNLGKAFGWYSRAAEQNHRSAQFNLGIMYYYGDGTEQNIVEAYKWWSIAADQGHKQAAAALSQAEQKMTSDELLKAKVLAAAWVKRRRTSEQAAPIGGWSGDIDKAKNAMSAGDYETAFKELVPLAEQGHVRAQFQIGELYSYGRGVEKDYAMAAKYYAMASEQGHAVSQRSLAFLYFMGRGVEKDIVEAYKWHTLAARTSKTSQLLRASIAKKMTAAQIEEGQARADAWLASHPGK